MIVADASVVVDMLLGPGSEGGDRLSDHLAAGDVIAVPHLVDVEVGNTLRRLAYVGIITEDEAWSMIEVLPSLPFDRRDHRGLLARAFDLRHGVSMYDATYLSLAEMLDRPLLTGDRRLVAVPGCDADVEVVAVGGG